MNKLTISELIVPGSLVSIRIGNEPTSFLNIIYRCTDDQIDIPLTEDLIKRYIFVDTNLTIKYKNEQSEYIIKGSVCKISLCGLPYISVKVADFYHCINCRKFTRRDVNLPASLSVTGNDIYFCTISNISLGGVSFVINKDLVSGAEYETNIYMNDNTSIYAKGIINKNSCNNSLYEYRMQFTYMNEENSNMLHTCLHDIEKSLDALKNKYLD